MFGHTSLTPFSQEHASFVSALMNQISDYTGYNYKYSSIQLLSPLVSTFLIICIIAHFLPESVCVCSPVICEVVHVTFYILWQIPFAAGVHFNQKRPWFKSCTHTHTSHTHTHTHKHTNTQTYTDTHTHTCASHSADNAFITSELSVQSH